MLTAFAEREAIYTTRKWIETFIIGLNLCPFAKTPFEKGEVRLVVKDAESMLDFVQDFGGEIEFLEANPTAETTLMILPALGNIQHFHAFMNFCEQAIHLNDWTDKYQIVSFHPSMRFTGLSPDSPQNLVGIAPYPILHILRVASVERLGASLKKDVVEENDKKLRKITKEEVAELWKKVLS